MTSVDVKTKEDGKCSGLAFVAFSTTEEANQAIVATNGQKFGSKTLDVQLAQRRERGSLTGEFGEGKGKGKDKGGDKGARGSFGSFKGGDKGGEKGFDKGPRGSFKGKDG